MKWKYSRLVALLLTLSSVLVVGCASVQSQHVAAADETRLTQTLMNEGLNKLDKNQLADASRLFNAGLKFAPDNANLNFLNALTYHLQYLHGNPASYELAVTGYELALSSNPAFFKAALQLGRVEFESRHYQRAVAAFQRAAQIDATSGDAFMGVAAAAYYDHDVALAKVAIDRASNLLSATDKPAALRAAAIIYAANGDDTHAHALLSDLGLPDSNATDPESLNGRVEQWRVWHASYSASDPAMGLVGAGPSSGLQVSTGTVAMPITAPQAAPQNAPGATPQNATASPLEPALANWTECAKPAGGPPPSGAGGPPPGGPGGPGGPPPGGGGAGGADDTTNLPALPVPCKGRGTPMMALMDVALVRSAEVASTNLGINLFDGLTYVLNQSKQVLKVATTTAGMATDTSGNVATDSVAITRQNSYGTPAAGITYSLNIANSLANRSIVLARPSLVVMDRQPSNTFAGNTVTFALPGGAGGGISSFMDKSSGVSLSLTPTFIDSDNLLLAVKASRSFIATLDKNASSGALLNLSKNSVSANVALKFGQTLILTGLNEKTVSSGSDGVPVLQDIPALQYLFRTSSDQTTTNVVLILITPRKITSDKEQIERALPVLNDYRGGAWKDFIPQVKKQLEADGGTAPSNLDELYRLQLINMMYLQFRAGDIRGADWSSPERMTAFTTDLRHLGYF